MVSVTGCPGVGKSVVGAALNTRFKRGVVLDMDLTERAEHASNSELILAWFEEWIRVAASIAQADRFLILTGFSRPWELESRPTRAWLSEIVHIMLTCSSDELVRRLGARWKSTDWPKSAIADLGALNEELQSSAQSDQSVSLIDTTSMSSQEVAESVAMIIRDRVTLARADPGNMRAARP